MFDRKIIAQLKEWQAKEERKPLMMLGARQVGKTSVLKRFGKECFEYCAYFSLDEEQGVCDIFRKTKNPRLVIEQLSFLTDVPIQPGKTLLILDEIQECPEAIAAMKYFSFPVGKVDHLEMYPVSFSEFLEQKDANLYRYYQSIKGFDPIPDVFFDRLSQAFIAYRMSGGMPEAAMKMLSFDKVGVETVLKNILKDYSFDFVKHASPQLANRISHVWNSLPSQLAKENRKFIYQLVRPGARAREYEDALTWLKNAGLLYKVSLCATPQLPLKSYEDLSIFKVYCLDIGLLRVLAEMDADIYLSDNPGFKEFKGALAENYVLQSLVTQGVNCSRYWSSGNKAEVEFIVQHGPKVIPIEVKSGTSVTGRSLVEYNKRYSPELRIRFSMLNLKKDDNLVNIPLFLADKFLDLVSAEF